MTSAMSKDAEQDDTLDNSTVHKAMQCALLSSRVQSVIAAMKQAGCNVHEKYFSILECNIDAGGGYSPKHGVILCRNQLRSKEQVHSTVLHELLHAYDDCRAGAKGLDWNDCQAHACTEVRAASLSGDCDWSQEQWRGNVSATRPGTWMGYHKRCVERRAALSVALNPKCREKGEALAAVREVLDRCMADKAPFVETAATAALPAEPGARQERTE